MPYQLSISSEAEQDINDCYNYLCYELEGVGNPHIAEKFKADLKKTFDIIGLYADSFAFCDDEDLRASGIRKIKLSRYRYLVFYHIEDGEVVVIDLVCHASRNYKNLL